MSSLVHAREMRTRSSVCMNLICGHKGARARKWSQSQVRFNLPGAPPTSGDESDSPETKTKKPVAFIPKPYVKRKRVLTTDEQYALDMRFVMKNIDCLAPKKDILESMKEGKKLPVPERDKWIRETPGSYMLP